MTYSEARGEAVSAFEHELKVQLGSASHYSDMMRAILGKIDILVEEQHIDHVMLFDGQSTSVLTGAILWQANLPGSLVREPSDDWTWVIAGEPPKEGDRILVVEDTYDALQRNKHRLTAIHTYTKACVCAALVFSAKAHKTRTIHLDSDELRVESIGRWHRPSPAPSRGDRETENTSVSRDNQREGKSVKNPDNNRSAADIDRAGIAPGSYTSESLPPVSELALQRYERNRALLAKRASAADVVEVGEMRPAMPRVRDRYRSGIRLTDKTLRSVLGAGSSRSRSRLRNHS